MIFTQTGYRKYWAVVRARLANLRQYAVDFLASLMTLPISLVILLYLFRAIAPEGARLGVYSTLQLAVYFVGVAITWQVVQPAGYTMWQSWQDINTGELAIYLSRPIDYVWYRYARSLASTAIPSVLALVIQITISAILGRFAPMESLQYFLALWLSYSTLFMWWFLVGGLSFWWERPFTFRDLTWNLITLLSGGLIPVDLLSPGLRAAAGWLPFQGVYYLPASLFAGTMGGLRAWAELGRQSLWLVALTLAARAVWAAGVRSYDGRGG